jgi:polar amino acid transport system substrate-binding protein
MLKLRIARLAIVPAALILTLSACGSSSPAVTTGPAEEATTVAEGGTETTVATGGTETTVATGGTETTVAGKTAETTVAGAPAADLKVKTAGKLTVCSDIPYAPFEFYENGADGAVVGIDADLLGAMAADNGLKADFIKTPFDGIFAALAAGNCDVIASSVSITDERKKSNDFTEPYFTIQQSILVGKDNATLNDTPALKGKKVGAQTGTTGADFAKAEATKNGFTVTEFQGEDEMITALKSGQVDAVIQDSPINGYAATQSNGDLVVSKTFEGAGEAYGFVVPKDNTGLRDALNASLKELQDTGKYKEIVAKYLGAAA